MEFRVRVVMFTANGGRVSKEKIFKTETARFKWLDAREQDGTLHEILAYSDEEA